MCSFASAALLSFSRAFPCSSLVFSRLLAIYANEKRALKFKKAQQQKKWNLFAEKKIKRQKIIVMLCVWTEYDALSLSYEIMSISMKNIAIRIDEENLNL